MTTQDFLIKWGVYGLALLPVWFCQAFVLNRLPFLPLTPMLLPLAAVCVAVLEGAVAGAGFGTTTNVVTLITHDGVEELPLMGKDEVAACLLNEIQRRR